MYAFGYKFVSIINRVASFGLKARKRFFLEAGKWATLLEHGYIFREMLFNCEADALIHLLSARCIWTALCCGFVGYLEG